ncbi:MAG: hypothetical protein WBX81_13840, partial [Nitrososphaeraceae archaeon]
LLAVSKSRTRICYSCGEEKFMDYELEKKLGTTIPVCPRCYITAILELDKELQSETPVEP